MYPVRSGLPRRQGKRTKARSKHLETLLVFNANEHHCNSHPRGAPYTRRPHVTSGPHPALWRNLYLQTKKKKKDETNKTKVHGVEIKHLVIKANSK